MVPCRRSRRRLECRGRRPTVSVIGSAHRVSPARRYDFSTSPGTGSEGFG